MPYGLTYEKAFWHSPSLSSGVLTTFPSSYSPCFALVFWFCGAKVVKGADDQIPRCYFACFLPAGFPFCLILGQSRVFQKNARNYLVMSSWSFTFNSTGKIENPDGDASADEGNKKKLALQETEKRKKSHPPRDSGLVDKIQIHSYDSNNSLSQTPLLLQRRDREQRAADCQWTAIVSNRLPAYQALCDGNRQCAGGLLHPTL